MAKTYLDETGLALVWAKIKAKFVSDVSYDATNKIIQQTRNGETSNVVTLAKIKTDLAFTKSDVGLGNVDNTADANKSVNKAATLTTPRKIDGVSFNGSANISHYATCSTAGATAAKTVSCTGFTYETGAWIAVKFDEVNTAENVTLNVNSLGAKNVYYRASQLGSRGLGQAGRVYLFVYDGTIFRLVGDLDTDTTYDSLDFGNGFFEATTPTDDVYNISTTGTIYADFSLSVGGRVSVWFRNVVTEKEPKLNINSTGAKPIYYNGSKINLGGNLTDPSKALIQSGAVVTMVYSGSTYDITSIEHPKRIVVPGYQYDSNGGNSTKIIRMGTGIGTGIGVGSIFPVTFTFDNTASSKLSLNVDGTGAKTLYINGEMSSSSNKTLPAGTYLVYYDGDHYSVRTDGYFPGEVVTYLAMPQSEATTGTSTNQRLITAKVLNKTIDDKIAASEVGAVMFHGSVTAYSAITGDSYKKGWYWLVGTNGAGTYAGQACEVGDMIFAIKDKGSSAADGDFTVVQNNLTAGSADPLMDGTKSVGTSAKYAREDHRHPTDTTRAPLASPGLTGTPTAPTAGSSTNNTQIATTAFVHSAIGSDVTAITEATINSVCV